MRAAGRRRKLLRLDSSASPLAPPGHEAHERGFDLSGWRTDTSSVTQNTSVCRTDVHKEPVVRRGALGESCFAAISPC